MWWSRATGSVQKFVASQERDQLLSASAAIHNTESVGVWDMFCNAGICRLAGLTAVIWVGVAALFTWGAVLGFETNFALEDAIGSHACSLEASSRVTSSIHLECSLSYRLAL
jgi:hypothetical protein